MRPTGAGAGVGRGWSVSSLDLDVAEYPRSGTSVAGKGLASSVVRLLLREPTLVNGDECSAVWLENMLLSVDVEGVTISGFIIVPGAVALGWNGNPAAGVTGAASVEGVVMSDVGLDWDWARSRSGEVLELEMGMGRGPRTELDRPDLTDAWGDATLATGANAGPRAEWVWIGTASAPPGGGDGAVTCGRVGEVATAAGVATCGEAASACA